MNNLNNLQLRVLLILSCAFGGSQTGFQEPVTALPHGSPADVISFQMSR